MGLYAAGAVAEPLVGGLGAIGSAEVDRFARDGFLAVADAFAPEDVDAVQRELAAITSDPSLADLLMYEPGVDPAGLATADDRAAAVRRLWDPVSVPWASGVRSMASDPDLARALRTLLGAEPEVFQAMALLKPPGIGTEKPWHQDHAYFALPLTTPVVGVWIALDEASEANGCMHVLPGRHRDGPVVHVQRRDWQICDDLVEGTPTTVVPLAPGGCLLFDSLLPHGTPPNTSPLRRRALQLHYAPTGAERIPHEERLAVFGPEGSDATC